jgi:hypothetical protein
VTSDVDLRPIIVDPAKLMLVDVVSGVDTRCHLAMVCRFTVVRDRVAVEIVYDPEEQAPSAAYYCPRERMRRIVVAPKSVKRIRPYATQP